MLPSCQVPELCVSAPTGCQGCSVRAELVLRNIVVRPRFHPIHDERRLLAAPTDKGQAPRVVLACDSQTDELEKELGQNGHQVVLIDLRCVGEVNSGMLLELTRQGAERVVVVGCGGDGCRYGTGALLAAKQVDQARSLLRTMGMDDRQLATDWTGERARELVEAPLEVD